ncbi:MAG: hypothetical protein PF495_12265, partial [Spirochaetales bacterium]|nr:hypothetical protein [Spirochaetales bacterium]
MQRYGEQRVLYGFTFGQDAVRENNVITFATEGTVVFGEKYNNPDLLTGRTKALKHFFEQADLSIEIPQNMLNRLWWKLMVNVGMNQVSALYGARYRELQQSGEVFDRMRQLMLEVIELSKFTESRLS